MFDFVVARYPQMNHDIITAQAIKFSTGHQKYKPTFFALAIHKIFNSRN